MSMTPTKELYENAVKTPCTSHVDERIIERREEWLIQTLMPIIDNLPISKAHKKMAERYLSRPIGHSLLVRKVSRCLIDMIIWLTIKPYNPRATMRFAPGGIIDVLTRAAEPYDEHPDMYRHHLWEQIRETAMDNIWIRLEKRSKKTRAIPIGWYSRCAVLTNGLIGSDWWNRWWKEWWQNRLYELSKFGFTKYTQKNIRFYLIVIMACRQLENDTMAQYLEKGKGKEND